MRKEKQLQKKRKKQTNKQYSRCYTERYMSKHIFHNSFFRNGVKQPWLISAGFCKTSTPTQAKGNTGLLWYAHPRRWLWYRPYWTVPGFTSPPRMCTTTFRMPSKVCSYNYFISFAYYPLFKKVIFTSTKCMTQGRGRFTLENHQPVLWWYLFVFLFITIHHLYHIIKSIQK